MKTNKLGQAAVGLLVRLFGAHRARLLLLPMVEADDMPALSTCVRWGLEVPQRTDWTPEDLAACLGVGMSPAVTALAETCASAPVRERTTLPVACRRARMWAFDRLPDGVAPPTAQGAFERARLDILRQEIQDATIKGAVT